MNNKEFTTSQSINIVKEMLKDKTLKRSKNKLEIGDLFFGVYDAKNKNEVYNKRPFIMLLKQNNSHMLGISFSWAPLPLRIILIKKILQVNVKNIKNSKPLEFDYSQLKPMLKKLGFAPIIRLYIKKRMSSSVVIVKPENLMHAARLNTAVFTNGVSADILYKKAISANKSYRKAIKDSRRKK